MTQTKVTNNEIAFSKTVDANGWTVYNYGAFKKYAKFFSGGSIGSLVSQANYTAISGAVLPVGMTDRTNTYTTSTFNCPTAEFTGSFLSVQTDTTLTLLIHNTYTGTLTASQWQFNVEITTL
jgi:hypothetical protein